MTRFLPIVLAIVAYALIVASAMLIDLRLGVLAAGVLLAIEAREALE